jgi:hypothetical protein
MKILNARKKKEELRRSTSSRLITNLGTSSMVQPTVRYKQLLFNIFLKERQWLALIH